MGGVIVDLLTPCLIFGKIVTNFQIEKWRSWVPILAYTYCKSHTTLVNVMLGIAFGYAISYVCRIQKKSEKKLMSVLMGFAHTGSIQLTLAATLQSTLD